MSFTYTLGELQEIEERCRAIAGEVGIEPGEVVYHLARPEEVYFAAANGLPARYSSARWGAQFESEYGRYRAGRSRIYELIFNTAPVHAYLMEGNSLVAQTLVIAHCLGHSHVFESNRWLGAVDRQIMPRVVSAAERIADYMAQHGRERVEDLLDACHAVAVHQPQAQLVRRAPAREPQLRAPSDYDGLFPEELADERQRGEQRRRQLRERFPREPEQDLLAFIERHGRGLQDWERDVISIVRSEQSYFLPQLRTQLLNEGAAVLCHQEICQRLFLPGEQYWEYEQLNASVVAPREGQVNPYNLGVELLREVMRIAADPDEQERERWSWAGAVEPFEQVRVVLRDYDDEALLREFLTPGVCERGRLYAFKRARGDPRLIRVSSREAEKVREVLVRERSSFGIPAIEVLDGDYRRSGELLLAHNHDGVGLDEEYARGTLVEVAKLWGRPCTVATIDGGDASRPVWFTGFPDGRSERHQREPFDLR